MLKYKDFILENPIFAILKNIKWQSKEEITVFLERLVKQNQ